MAAILNSFKKMPRELKIFALATIAMGMGYNIYDSTFNNYINSLFHLTGFQRSFLEIPREIPGLLTVFLSALLWFLCSRRMGVLAMILGAIGSLLVGFVAPTYAVLTIWVFIYSVGSHLFLPLQSAIGMELAEENKVGQRLGQLNSLRNLAAIFGSFLVFLGFKYFNFTFQTTFVLTAVILGVAAVLMFTMKPNVTRPPRTFFKLHREYSLYYLLAILYGSRKQIFLTFGPWVLVTVFDQPTQVMATLLMVGGIIGILFQPALGWMIDHLGEKKVIQAEAFLLVFVCLGYGFSGFLFSKTVALYITFICFLLDQMLMSVNMARATYMKKIAVDPADIQPALTVAVTIDHVFSISIALLGGLIWNAYGFQYVFLVGTVIAAVNFFTASRIKLPQVVKTEYVPPLSE
jgi:predicted MFS family arabinose efflux permease